MPFTETTEPDPPVLRTDRLVLRPITVEDVEDDYDAVMETREDLRLWQGSAWPADDFTVDGNLVDLRDMQERHVALRAFSYTVRDTEDTCCLGCVYVFPTTATFLARSEVRALGEARWEDVDAVVFFWTRASATEQGLDAHLLEVMRRWFRDVWKLERTTYASNVLFTRQLALLRGTDLVHLFDVDEPDMKGTRPVFG